jgi:hypothetical protein
LRRSVGDVTREWSDALPGVLGEAVERALADLQHPTTVPIEKVTFERDREDDRYGLLTVWFADGGRTGLGLEVGSDPAEVIADVADLIQGMLPEEREAWAEARPPCPGHPHPAVALTVDGIACWVCPSESRVIGQIGHMKDGPGPMGSLR